jgi:hypothetical protein
MNQGGNGHRHRPRHGATPGTPPPGGRRRRKGAPSPEPEKGPAPAPAAPSFEEAPAGPAGPPEQALERLRTRVLDAVRELERLREENDALAARLADLEAQQGRALPDAFFDGGDPAVLRERVEGFIEALDTYLAQDE